MCEYAGFPAALYSITLYITLYSHRYYPINKHGGSDDGEDMVGVATLIVPQTVSDGSVEYLSIVIGRNKATIDGSG